MIGFDRGFGRVYGSLSVSSANPDRDLIHQLEEQALAHQEAARKIWDAIGVLRGAGQVSSRWRADRKEPGHHIGSMPSYILPFLREHPDRAFSVREIFEGMKEMGWIPNPTAKDPLASLSSCLLRQNQQGNLRRSKRGRYQAVELDNNPAGNVAHLRPGREASSGS